MVNNKAALLKEFIEADANRDLFPLEKDEKGFIKPELYHYTSLKTLFCMLESDSFWVSSSRFSNDSSEEMLLSPAWRRANNYKGDNFIFCVSDKNDLLSQWRAYCPSGGVSIGLDVAKINTYSVLCSNHKESGGYKNIDGMAVPLIYADEDNPARDAKGRIDKIEKRLPNKKLLNVHDFIPFIKHGAFSEERERRLLFSNTNKELSECICFREIANGTKLPYIVVKGGYFYKIKKTKVRSRTPRKFLEKEIVNIINKAPLNKVILPACPDQEELCDCVRDYIIKNMDADSSKDVFCEGHLPIRSITIAPMLGQDRIKEQVDRFCKSKYWLKDVNVRESKIPYVPSLNS